MSPFLILKTDPLELLSLSIKGSKEDSLESPQSSIKSFKTCSSSSIITNWLFTSSLHLKVHKTSDSTIQHLHVQIHSFSWFTSPRIHMHSSIVLCMPHKMIHNPFNKIHNQILDYSLIHAALSNIINLIIAQSSQCNSSAIQFLQLDPVLPFQIHYPLIT